MNIQLFFNFSMQRKKCLIAQGYWILLLGKWILFSTCPTGMWSFFGEFKLQKNCNQSSYSLPERQAVKVTFFAPCTFFKVLFLTGSLHLPTGFVPFFDKKIQRLFKDFQGHISPFSRPFKAKKSLDSMYFLVLPQHEQFYSEGLSVFSPFLCSSP